MRAMRVALAVFALSLASTGVAHAHSAGLSRGEYRFEDGTLFCTITFARGEVGDLVPHLDANRDGLVSADEVKSASAALEQAFVGGMRVSAGGSACAGAIDRVRLVEGDGLEVSAEWTCPAPAAAADLELDYLDALSRGHRHLLTLVGATSGGATFAYREEKRFAVPAVHTAPRVGWAERSRLMREGAMAALRPLGLLMILLAFGGTRRELSLAALAFAAAAGASGFLAAHSCFAESFVAPGVALAVIFAGIEGIASTGSGRGRWISALVLGAVIGVWHAAGLRDVAMPVRERASAIVPFTIGGALLLGVLGAAGVLGLARISEWPVWRRLSPIAAFLALGGGAWLLVRALLA